MWESQERLKTLRQELGIDLPEEPEAKVELDEDGRPIFDELLDLVVHEPDQVRRGVFALEVYMASALPDISWYLEPALQQMGDQVPAAVGEAAEAVLARLRWYEWRDFDFLTPPACPNLPLPAILSYSHFLRPWLPSISEPASRDP